MASVNSVYRFWSFAEEVKRRSRFVRTREAEDFLGSVAATVASRRATLQEGRVIWRAQVGNDYQQSTYDDEEARSEPCPLKKERMIPDPNKRADNRASARGIPCIYAASDRDTAMAEVRPWIGSYISLGCFKTTRELSLVDCSKHHEHSEVWMHIFGRGVADVDKQRSQEELSEMMWAGIDYEFARPVTRTDDLVDYVPTQIIADLFRSLNYDGLIYKIKLSADGLNIPLFNIETIEIIGCKLFRVKNLRFEFEEEAGAASQWGKTMLYQSRTRE